MQAPGTTAAEVLDYLCVDIETTAGRPDAIEEYIRRTWWPNEAWTEPTIGRRFKEAIEKWNQKGALLDAAKIAVVALNHGREGRLLLHCLEEQPARVEDYAMVSGYATEREMLINLREALASLMDEETLWVGHNIRDFDLPRLRLAYLRAGLQIPKEMSRVQPLFDSMHEFCRAFSIERSGMVGLEEVLKKLGMESHKGLVDGSMIDELIAKREFEVILRYAALDVKAEAEVFLRLTGRSGELV